MCGGIVMMKELVTRTPMFRAYLPHILLQMSQDYQIKKIGNSLEGGELPAHYSRNIDSLADFFNVFFV